jgi:hypothetical protein
MYKVQTLIIAKVKVEFQKKKRQLLHTRQRYHSGTMVCLFLQAATGITQGCKAAS